MINFNDLVNPISNESLCGEDISFSREIDAISEARRFDDSTLDQGAWVTELKTANWPYVIENCSALLASKSKDLRLAVWLTEASSKVFGFAGLAEGYLLLTELCDKFWEDVYPLPDEDGQEQRIGNLHWLLLRSIHLIKEMPITEGHGRVYSILDYEKVSAENAKAVAMEQDTSEEVMRYAAFEVALRKSSPAFYKKLFHDIKHCQYALAEFERAVDEKLGTEGPSFSAARDELAYAASLIARFAKELGVDIGVGQGAVVETAREQHDIVAESATSKADTRISVVIQSRQQALAQLRLIADYFRRTEPHSPVAYLAEKAAYWGEMPLHSWLATVVKDPAVLSHFEDLLGFESAKRDEQ